jgi:hypothetical protein
MMATRFYLHTAASLHFMQRGMHTRSEIVAFLMNAMYTVKPGGGGDASRFALGTLPVPVPANRRFPASKRPAMDLERSVSSGAGLAGGLIFRGGFGELASITLYAFFERFLPENL